MQYEQTTAHMEDSSNHSSIFFKCHPEHTCYVWVTQAIQK